MSSDFVARHALHALIKHAELMTVRNANAAGREEAYNWPFVPRRQLTLRHFSSANAASAGPQPIWDAALRGLPASATEKIKATSAG